MENMIHIHDTLLSDSFKDAYGFRPRNHYKTWWTEKELEEEYERLYAITEANMEAEAYAEAEALKKFEKLIKDTINYGAGDRETAIRWLLQSDNVSKESHRQDIDHFFWQHGLSLEKIDEFTDYFLNSN